MGLKGLYPIGVRCAEVSGDWADGCPDRLLASEVAVGISQNPCSLVKRDERRKCQPMVSVIPEKGGEGEWLAWCAARIRHGNQLSLQQ